MLSPLVIKTKNAKGTFLFVEASIYFNGKDMNLNEGRFGLTLTIYRHFRIKAAKFANTQRTRFSSKVYTPQGISISSKI